MVRCLRLDASSGLCVTSVAELHVHELEMLAGGVEKEGEERGGIPYVPLSSAWERYRKRSAANRKARGKGDTKKSGEAKWKVVSYRLRGRRREGKAVGREIGASQRNLGLAREGLEGGRYVGRKW